MSSDSELQQRVDALTDSVRRLGVQNLVQGMALQALARLHPEPALVADDFRASMDETLADLSAQPEYASLSDAAREEAEAFLEALGELDQDDD